MTTSFRFFGWKRDTQPTTKASDGMPSSARTLDLPFSSNLISSVRTAFGRTTTWSSGIPASTSDALVPAEIASTISARRAARR
jgi:hypothetical protein